MPSASVPATAKQACDTRDPRQWGWVEPTVWSERMLAALVNGVTGGKWYSLWDKVSDRQTLEASWRAVARNQGAAGVDGQSVQRFAAQAERYLDELAADLQAGRYQPNDVRRTYIPKAGGGQRPLGIPTVKDRIVQGAVKRVLEPIFEREFLDVSYGFRPGRGAKDALRAVDQHLKAGHTWVVDADLKSYFDTIPHATLLEEVAAHLSDGRVLALIQAYLEQGILEGLQRWMPTQGTPQGAELTPRTQKVTSSLTGRWRLIGSKPGLTCDANGNIYMTYGAIDRFADGRTSQRCPWVARARAQRPGGVCVYVASIRPLAPSSVPLPAGSAVAARAGGAAGARGPGDLQAAAASGESPSPAGRRRWHDPQRDGGAGLGRLSGRGGPWRLGMARSRSSSSNTLSTACSDPSWSRSMRSWCPNSAASSAPPPR